KFSGQARWSCQRFRPGYHLSGDLRSPMGSVGRDLERDACAVHSKDLPTFGKHRSPLGGETSDAPTNNKQERVCLPLIGTLVDEKASPSFSHSPPHISFPPSDAEEAETVELDVAVVATLDVPEEHRLAVAVVRGLGEGAGTRDGAAAVVEPVSGDVPAGTVGHGGPLLPMSKQ